MNIQSINRRRYLQKDIEEGIEYLRHGMIPNRLDHNPTRQTAFQQKWSAGTVENNKIIIGGREVVPVEQVHKILTEAYQDPAQQGGRDKLHDRLLRQYIGISRRTIMAFLKRQETWQLHQPLPPSTNNTVSIPSAPFSIFQMDLIDLSPLAGHNNNDHFVLTIIDKFSKYAYAYPLKNKSGPVVFQAIESILLSAPHLPQILVSDNGTEFSTWQLHHYLERIGVKHLYTSSYSPQSNGCVERFNQSLKRMIYRHLSQYQTKKYNDVMSLLLENYNSVKHSSTGFSPLTLHTLYQVQPARDADVVIDRVRTKLTNVAKKMLTPVPPHQARVKKGDIVRISARTMSDERKNTFRKHYWANWSVQLYTVVSVSKGTELSRPQFKLATKQGHIVKQRFYQSDLQLVDVDSLEINEKKRPDYSAGRIFNQEEHLQRIHDQGPQHPIILPPAMQGQERQRGSRMIKPRIRLIDELLQQAEQRENRNRENPKENTKKDKNKEMEDYKK